MTKKRRGHGEGGISRRKDGRWEARITVGYTADGKRKRKTIYGRTKREVQEKLAILQHQKATGTLTDASTMTVAEWLTHWLDNIAKPKLRPTTAEGYRSIKDFHLIPRVGGIRLAKFTAVNLQAMYAEMQKDGHSGRTCQRVHAVLRRALNVAVRQRLIPQNACQLVDVPKYDKPEMKTLSSEHAMKLMAESAGDRYHALIVLALTTGMRQGEMFGLKWEDIDLDAGRLSVRRTLLEINGKHSFGPPKSKAGNRSIKLPDAAVQALWDHKALMVKKGFAGCEMVFCDSDGGLLRKSNFLRYYFRPLLARAEVPTVRFHDLRHTSATLMLADNVHPKIVQRRLGHSQISLTLDTYSHVTPEMDDAAAATFDRLWKRNA